MSAFFETVREDARAFPVPQVTGDDPIAERLTALLLLDEGWDGDAAPAPSRVAVQLGQLVLALARERGFDVDRVAPDVEGGVAAYFFGGETLPDGGTRLQVGLLASNDGELVLYVRDRQTPGALVEEIDATPDAIDAILGRIKLLITGS